MFEVTETPEIFSFFGLIVTLVCFTAKRESGFGVFFLTGTPHVALSYSDVSLSQMIQMVGSRLPREIFFGFQILNIAMHFKKHLNVDGSQLIYD